MGKIPSHYQLKKENPDHYIISDQRDNSEFPVAKKDLDDGMHAKIRKMAHYDEGTPDGPVGSPADNVNQSTSTGGATGSWDPAPQPTASPSLSVAPIQTPTIASPDLQKQYDANAAQEVAGLKAQSDAKTRQASDEAAALKGSNDLQQKVFDDAQAHEKETNAKLDALSSDVAAGKVDPHRYMHNMSTGNKIVAAIALGLGGMASAQNGGVNPALEFINKAIANDIDAQKSDIANKKSLYSENLQRYGDEQKATQATMAQLSALAKGKLDQIALQRSGGANDANYQILSSQLKNQNLLASHQLGQQVAQDKMRNDLMSGGQESGADPLAYVRYVVPEAHQKDAINEIGQAKSATENEQKMMDVFDQAAKENTVMRTGAGLARTPPSIKVFNALADPLIHDNEGRINELEQKHIQALAPAPGDMANTIEEKRRGLQDFINHKKEAPTAKAFGIDVSKFNATKTPVRNPYEGKTASDGKGNKIVMKNGQWVPLGR